MQHTWRFKKIGLVLMAVGGGLFLLGTLLWVQYSWAIPYKVGIAGWIVGGVGAILYLYGLLRSIFQ